MTNESKTLFIPLYGKAAMSREGIFQDETAERIVESLPEEMQNVDTSRRLAIFMAMRAARYDVCAAYAPPEDLNIDAIAGVFRFSYLYPTVFACYNDPKFISEVFP